MKQIVFTVETFKTTIWVSLDLVYTGGEQILQIQGQGGPQTIKVQIPKGVENGAQLRYDGLIAGGVLIVEFRVHVHTRFDRAGQDLISPHRISVLDLIVGTSFDFITIPILNIGFITFFMPILHNGFPHVMTYARFTITVTHFIHHVV
jgi:hypothetical protein